MPIQEVFPNATVREVVFQIRFPTLLFLPERMGDLQVRLMERFPEASVATRRQFMVADVEEDKFDSIRERLTSLGDRKVWQFSSPDGVHVEVEQDNVVLRSTKHRTYALGEPHENFRNAIEFVVQRFLEVVKIPRINRVGFLYVDEMPIPNGSIENIPDWYNTTFPVDRFPLSEGNQMEFKYNGARGDHRIAVREVLAKNDEGVPGYGLSFDAYANGVSSNDVMATVDQLHDIDLAEYEAFLKDPALAFLRGGG